MKSLAMLPTDRKTPRFLERVTKAAAQVAAKLEFFNRQQRKRPYRQQHDRCGEREGKSRLARPF